MSDLPLWRRVPEGPPPLVRVLRIDELKDGDILILGAEAFSKAEHFLTAAQDIMKEARKRGINLSPILMIARPGHEEDFFYIDEKQLNNHGFYKQEGR